LRILLDTHVLLWWLSGSPRLSPSARKAIADSQETYVSAVSVWEISIKLSLGKLQVNGDLEEHLHANHFLPLPVTLGHAMAAGKLPRLHQDPFDRMLVAQASIESLTILTADKQLAAYGGQVSLA
jgi:PIN domain nuclease of toxin-antitoxin system